MATARYWLLRDRLLTSGELKQAGISPLRCVNLGRHDCRGDAQMRSVAWLGRRVFDEALVLARNARRVGDNGRGARWGLSREQVAALQAGELLHLRDALGAFTLGYRSRTNEVEEERDCN